MRFAMECFNPYPLVPYSIWLNILLGEIAMGSQTPSAIGDE
jgi:hypothetical protein